MKKVHFIGIGGIGISALARFLKEKDFIISGSDIKESDTIKELRDEGIEVVTPHSKEIIKDQDFVVYSAAIKPDNVEIVEASEPQPGFENRMVNPGNIGDISIKKDTPDPNGAVNENLKNIWHPQKDTVQ